MSGNWPLEREKLLTKSDSIRVNGKDLNDHILINHTIKLSLRLGSLVIN